VVEKKIEQFTKWVEEDKENTAANMLNAAVNNLKALIHHVEAQKGKHIDEETADQLIAQAEELIMKMETTMSSMNTKGKGKQVSTQARTQEQEMEMEMERKGGGRETATARGRLKAKTSSRKQPPSFFLNPCAGQSPGWGFILANKTCFIAVEQP
jgi:hypothetical protein